MSALLPIEGTPKPSPKRTRSARAGLVHDADGNLVGEKIPPSPLVASATAPRQKRKRGPAPSKARKESYSSSPLPTSSAASPVPDLGAIPPIPSLENATIATSPSPSSTMAPSPTISSPPKEVGAAVPSSPRPTPPEAASESSEVPKAAESMQIDPQPSETSEDALKDMSNPSPQLFPRSEPQPAPIPVKVNPHAFYFYQNGDLLIEVEGVHFKLFWDRIIKASAFFKEIYDSAKNDESKKALLMGNEVVVLTGMDVMVDDLVILLDMVESIKPPQTQTHSLRYVLSILNASHALSFHGYADWAKEQLSTLWSVGDDFENLSSITTLSPQEVARSVALARKCDIPSILKPAVFSLVRLPSFGGSGQTTPHSFDLVQCGERLLWHWVATLNRLVLPTCASSPAVISTDASTLPTPCTANDPVKSRFFHYKTIYETGFFQVYINDTISGLQGLKEQLVPITQLQTVPPSRKKRRKLSEEPEVKSVPDVGKWADPNVGGYCESCVEKMWDICAEGMEECWGRLDEWAGVKSASSRLTRRDVS
ncbi:hypothetical protein BDN72DRAFT_962663 [Pluteus cervinus]|uniref:Uncharacterized protein n=1 Tax=Pluteus cervinus TaxID=181527 RepID=A0ACD3AI32_9AGAR|nr:hypothetical protein BDN72DRAFT_962663 [Pluteus cervinus]